jgi:hypothetical protein
MARRIAWLGTDRQSNAGYQLAPGVDDHPSFPDAQPKWTSATDRAPWPDRVRPVTATASDGRAFCLATNTDWDAVDVNIDDDPTPVRLVPGLLIRRQFKRLTVSPPGEILQIPTRQYSGANLLDVNTRPVPRLPANIGLVARNDDVTIQVKATGGAVVSFKVWNGSAWVAGPAGLTALGDTADICTIFQGGIGPTNYRPADISPDGIWSMADLFRLGACDGGVPATLQIRGRQYPANRHYDGSIATPPLGSGIKASQFAFDANGNPGDATNPSVALYPTSDQTAISPYWFGRCGLEIWDQEEAPCDYRPRLDAERRIVLDAILSMSSSTPGQPSTPILAFPGFNVDTVQFQARVRADSPASVTAGIAQGTAYDPIDQPFPVFSSPIDLAAAGAGLSPQAQLQCASWVQLLVGSELPGGGTIAVGSEIIIRRKFIGG